MRVLTQSKATGAFCASLRRYIPLKTSTVRLFVHFYILASLFDSLGGRWQGDQLSGILVAAAAEESVLNRASEWEETWDTTYVFNPTPAFWRPLDSFPVESFPPYELGHHVEPPHRLIYASCNRQPEGTFGFRTDLCLPE